MRRLVCWVLAAFLVLPGLFGAVRAADAELEQRIIDSCKYNEKVDISDYKLTVEQLEELYYRLQAEGKLPWYASHEYTYYYSELTDLMLEFEPILLEETEAAAETEIDENGEEIAPVKADFISRLNPDSLKVIRALAEPAIADAEVGAKFQFLRMGYFCKDPDSTDALPVYNRTVGLKDTWAKQANK